MKTSTNRFHDSQKELEHSYLDMFIQNYPEFPGGKVTQTEEPDFIISEGEGLIGIELTEFHRPNNEKGPLRGLEEERNLAVQGACNRYKSKGLPSIDVAVTWFDDYPISRNRRIMLEEELADLVRDSIPNANNSLVLQNQNLQTRISEDRFFDVLQERERTVGDLMNRYLTECSIKKVPQNQARDRQILNHLLPHFGANTTLIDITPRVINAYKAKRRHEGAAPATINKEIGLLSNAFNVAIKEWEWCRDNPVQRVRMEPVNNQIERWLTVKEEEMLLAASPSWLQDIITFALHSGMRRGEILNLQWQDIDFLRGTMVVMKSKNKQRRTIPLNRKVFELLVLKQQHQSQESPLVFTTSTGTPISPRNLTRGFQSARKKANIQDFRFHDLRHTFATRLVQAGIDLYQVQRLLGHKKPDMTQRYAHHCPESLREGVEVLTRRVVSHFYHTPLTIQGEKSASA